MNKKSIRAILIGVLTAGIVCLLAGMIVYLVSVNTQIASNVANYSQLVRQKQFASLMGIFLMITGGVFATPPMITLIVMAVASLVRKIKYENN
jgi:hypothetical protein